MAQKFNEKQKEIIARRMGYEGPMQGFDEFLKSDPALSLKYNTIIDKYMARGGLAKKKVRKFQEGGAATTTGTATDTTGTTATTTGTTTTGTGTTATTTMTPLTGVVWGASGKMYDSAAAAEAAGETSYSTTPTIQTATAPAATASTIAAGTGQAGPAQTATLQTTGPAQTAAAPTKITSQTIEATQAQPKIQEVLSGVTAAQGEVRPEALIEAQTKEPTTTAVADLEAAQAKPKEFVQVKAPKERVLQAGEMVSEAPTTDWAKIEEQLAKTQAVEGVVTEEMTAQGQLNKMMQDFDAGNPPPWASAAIRSATAQMAARGLGASSLAGQALIQAAIESATPIAAATAQVYERMGLQNLSNRQAVALANAEVRAKFLGQEFDQAFQARVLNAAKVSDIANMNFTAGVQIAMENARLTQSVNLANLSNRQAMVMAKAAAMSQLEVQNLSNMQQAAVENAKAFLQMDLTNLQYKQQTELFKAQELSQAILSDTAAANAAKQFNAANKQQADQFNSNLAAQVSQFNATQANAMTQFNTSQANALSQFNASQQNAMAQFNAENALQVAQANAQLATQVSTANTAAQTQVNIANAQAANSMSTTVYNGQVQMYRDSVEYAFRAGESELERENRLALQKLSFEASKYAADKSVDAAMYTALGSLSAAVLGRGDGVDLIKSAMGVVKEGVTGVSAAAFAGLNKLFGLKTEQQASGTTTTPDEWAGVTASGGALAGWQWIANTAEEGQTGFGWEYFIDPEGTTFAISPDNEYYVNGQYTWSPDMNIFGTSEGE